MIWWAACWDSKKAPLMAGGMVDLIAALYVAMMVDLKVGKMVEWLDCSMAEKRVA